MTQGQHHHSGQCAGHDVHCHIESDYTSGLSLPHQLCCWKHGGVLLSRGMSLKEIFACRLQV
jgi:hypothetical protein